MEKLKTTSKDLFFSLQYIFGQYHVTVFHLRNTFCNRGIPEFPGKLNFLQKIPG